jgi:hypothetical protein
MLFPAVTGLGVPLSVTARSQIVVTGVAVVVLLLAELGSEVEEETVEVAVMVVAAIEDATFTTTIILAEAPEARLASVQVTVPVAPTAGVVQIQPAGAEMDAKVVLVGTTSVKVAFVELAGPLFVTV